MRGCKSHADRLGIPIGVSGETVQGVLISDTNRRTEFYEETDVEMLRWLLQLSSTQYRPKNIPSAVFGLQQPDGTAQYALYVGGARA